MAASFDTASTAADDTVQDIFRKESAGGERVGELVGSTCEEILEKAGGEPEWEPEKQRSEPLVHCCVNAVPTNLVDMILGVVHCIGERFCFSVPWVESFCCRPPPSRLVPNAGETERPRRPASGLASSVHVTLVNQKIPVGSTGDSSSVGHGVEANPATSLVNAIVHPPDRITADLVEVVPPAPDTIVADETAAAATVNLGDSENPIDVGVLSRSDFELILAVCPPLA